MSQTHLVRQIIVIIYCLVITASAFCQRKARIGQLRFINCEIIKRDKTLEDICGISVPAIRVTVSAKTRCQLTCNFGDPSKNIYETVINKFVVCYCYDSSDILNKAILKEIELKNNIWNTIVRYDSTNKDYQGSFFNKSFFVNKNQTIPYVSTDGEREGDYQIFYINKRAYKIILVEGNGMGSISSFREQNILFMP